MELTRTEMKTNLNIAYQNDNVRVFKLDTGFVVEGVKNRIYKKISTAIKRADEEDLRIELSKLFNQKS